MRNVEGAARYGIIKHVTKYSGDRWSPYGKFVVKKQKAGL